MKLTPFTFCVPSRKVGASSLAAENTMTSPVRRRPPRYRSARSSLGGMRLKTEAPGTCAERAVDHVGVLRGEAEDLENIDRPGARTEPDAHRQERAGRGDAPSIAVAIAAHCDAGDRRAVVVVAVRQRVPVGALEVEPGRMQPDTLEVWMDRDRSRRR